MHPQRKSKKNDEALLCRLGSQPIGVPDVSLNTVRPSTPSQQISFPRPVVVRQGARVVKELRGAGRRGPSPRPIAGRSAVGKRLVGDQDTTFEGEEFIYGYMGPETEKMIRELFTER